MVKPDSSEHAAGRRTMKGVSNSSEQLWCPDEKKKWCRYLEEVLGMPAMAALGRLRRRLAAASLCALLCAGSCASLRDPAQCAHALSLSFVCLSEDAEFKVGCTCESPH